jgi:hypothetical protein
MTSNTKVAGGKIKIVEPVERFRGKRQYQVPDANMTLEITLYGSEFDPMVNEPYGGAFSR